MAAVAALVAAVLAPSVMYSHFNCELIPPAWPPAIRNVCPQLLAVPILSNGHPEALLCCDYTQTHEFVPNDNAYILTAAMQSDEISNTCGYFVTYQPLNLAWCSVKAETLNEWKEVAGYGLFSDGDDYNDDLADFTFYLDDDFTFYLDDGNAVEAPES